MAPRKNQGPPAIGSDTTVPVTEFLQIAGIPDIRLRHHMKAYGFDKRKAPTGTVYLADALGALLAFLRDDHLSTKEICRELDIGAEMLDRLVAKGLVEKRHDGSVSLRKAARGLIAILREQRKAGSNAKQRIENAKAQQIELQNAQARGEVINLEDVKLAQDMLVSLLRTAMTNIPAQVTRDIELRRKLEDAIDTGLNIAADALLSAASNVAQEAMDDAEDLETADA